MSILSRCDFRDRGREDAGVVLVEAEHEAALDHDAGPVQPVHHLAHSLPCVLKPL